MGCCCTKPIDPYEEDYELLTDPPLSQDMSAPLSHYFISSGHNSYLLGNQLTDSAGVGTIVSSLLLGCRVIELDVYNAGTGLYNCCCLTRTLTRDAGPLCYHGGTAVAPVAFRHCVQAVADHGFTRSPYPVIITLENHCDAENQQEMARMLAEILGDRLFVPPERPKQFLSPEALKGKVLIRDKPKYKGYEEGAVPKMHPDLARLVYIENVKFDTFTEAAAIPIANSRSFSEDKIVTKLEKDLEGCMKYAQRNLIRCFPAGSRVGSSSYEPSPAWSCGAQIVALNWQRWNEAIWTNIGKFSANGYAGFVKKPDWMLANTFTDPRALQPRTRITLKILSARLHKRNIFGCRKLYDLFVKGHVYGLKQDETTFKTKVHRKEIAVFKTDNVFVIDLAAPELAVLLLKLKDYDTVSANDLYGLTAIPLSSLRGGRYKIPLHSVEWGMEPLDKMYIGIEVTVDAMKRRMSMV